MAIWLPRLEGRRGPKYLQIVEVLSEDIASGELRPGTRLLPHRELAYQLGVSANTTSRAYAVGVSRGLIQGEVGRGTFVRAPGSSAIGSEPGDLARPNTGPIDLSRNLPCPGLAASCLSETLEALAREPGLDALTDYQTGSDLAHHADAGIAWLGKSGVPADRDEVVITNGGQHAILCALMAVTRPGDLLLTEELTYPPVKALAGRLGLKVRPVALDDGGLVPDALEDICREHAARALYFMPNLQTPTSATLSTERRARIAEIAERYDLILIEDDVFGLLKQDRPAPVVTLAPERTIYLTSTSKCLAPGLRVGFARAPELHAPAMRSAVNMTSWMTPPLMVEIVARWIADGTADKLAEHQRAEASRRQTMARGAFEGHDVLADPHGLHLWLRLPPVWPAHAFRAEAEQRGVLLVDGDAFAVRPGARQEAVRLCLSHEADCNRLQRGLEVLRKLLEEPPTQSSLVI